MIVTLLRQRWWIAFLLLSAAAIALLVRSPSFVLLQTVALGLLLLAFVFMGWLLGAARAQKAAKARRRAQKKLHAAQTHTDLQQWNTLRHDLRQPVHSMGMLLARLQQMPMEPDAQHMVKTLQASLRMLDEQIDGLRVLVPAVDPGPESPEAQVSVQSGTYGYSPKADLVGTQVMLLDDDSFALETLRELLTSWGCGVHTAANMTEAAALLPQIAPPDVLVSDYRLAGGDTGIQAIAAVREAAQRNIPAFLLSGDTNEAVVQSAREAGLVLLHKPVRPAKLRSLLRRLTNAANPQNSPEGNALTSPAE
jgi:CheY-like chemotaxis protein